VEEMKNKRNADMGVVELLGWKQKERRMNRNGGGACYFVPAVIIATVGSWKNKIKGGLVWLCAAPTERYAFTVQCVFIC
jgi:hypothetical protein